MAAPPASAIPARCPSRSPRRSTRATSSSPRCCRATATSRAASIRRRRANYLASPPLVVAYALAGSMKIDLTKDPLGTGKDGKPVYLKDIWPTQRGDRRRWSQARHAEMFQQALRRRLQGRRALAARSRPTGGLTYDWDDELDLRPEPALFRRHGARRPAPIDRHHGRAAARPSSAIRSPPTTSRPAGSIKTGQPGRRST